MQKIENNLTQGSVSRNLIRFSLPFMLSNLLQALYNVADMVIVGRFCGTYSISGVAIGGQVTLMVINMVNGFAVGGTVLVSQYLGAKRAEDEKQTVGTLFSVFAIASVAITAGMLIFAVPVLRLLGTPEESFSEALDYLRICMGGTIFILGYNSVSAVLRGMGDSKRPLLFVAVATVVNIILDLLFVGLFGWNAAGAAAATVLAQALSFIWAVFYLKKTDFVFDFKLKSFQIKWDKLKLLVRVGVPTALQMTITSFSFLALTRLVNSYGVVASSIQGISGKAHSFGILPNIAVSGAISAMAGQNIGAGEHERALKTMKVGILLAACVSTVITTVFCLFPGPILSLFDSNPEVAAQGANYLRIISLEYIITAAMFGINGLITASGHTKMTLLNVTISGLLVRIPLAYLLAGPGGMGMLGVATAMTCAPLAALIVGFIYLKSGHWKTKRLIADPIKDLG